MREYCIVDFIPYLYYLYMLLIFTVLLNVGHAFVSLWPTILILLVVFTFMFGILGADTQLISQAVKEGQRPDRGLLQEKCEFMDIQKIVEQCWEQKPEDRPTFQGNKALILSCSVARINDP